MDTVSYWCGKCRNNNTSRCPKLGNKCGAFLEGVSPKREGIVQGDVDRSAYDASNSRKEAKRKKYKSRDET